MVSKSFASTLSPEKGTVVTKKGPLIHRVGRSHRTIHPRWLESTMTEATETQTNDVESLGDNKKQEQKSKRTSDPPEGYVCNLCSIKGHWIQQCPTKEETHNKKRKKKAEHEYRPGVDPSTNDIERAKRLQSIKPPHCDCGITSRLKKVKRSNVSEGSRANGRYFFFCAKKKSDATKCNFAQPVEENKSPKEKTQANFFAKKRRKS
jgi:Zinc knuckle